MSHSRHDGNAPSTFSPTAEFLGSALSSVIGYPASHTITSGIVRYQRSDSSALSMIFQPKTAYQVVLNNPYTGFSHLPQHVASLFNGYTVGLIYKTLQTMIRYPTQSYLAKKIKSDPDSVAFFQGVVGEKHADGLIKATAGSGGGITEGITCHAIDTLRNQIISAKTAMTYRQMYNLAVEQNLRLFNGIHWTLARNSIGGFVQFGSYAGVMTYAFHVEPENATKTQITSASFIAAALMIIFTMPFDNKKLGAQLGYSHSGFFSLFKGAVPKMLTKGIGPATILALKEMITPFIDSKMTPAASPEEQEQPAPRKSM